MINEQTDCQKVTGKQVLCDCVTLAKDLGLYIAELSRRMYETLKCAFKCKDSEVCKEPDCAAD